ncbi:hypothetical protein DC345_30260 [Paenibacillus taichungensis]|uniref:Uncharacterized protein n=1 Tax=Paenibacillus taichungensis TaxID=484184 RepID=A0A329QBL6_9BACL|nr:hypothetical protein [Paenibacillus taichungensis]RAW09746.1 hypothetical protein DC345_30260 [Paenibacillus taichungensis]
MQYYHALETRSLSKADGIYDKMVYKWDVSKKKYIKVIYGQDEIEDTKQKKVDNISSKMALNLLQNACKKQISMPVPITLNNFNKKLETLVYKKNTKKCLYNQCIVLSYLLWSS